MDSPVRYPAHARPYLISSKRRPTVGRSASSRWIGTAPPYGDGTRLAMQIALTGSISMYCQEAPSCCRFWTLSVSLDVINLLCSSDNTPGIYMLIDAHARSTRTHLQTFCRPQIIDLFWIFSPSVYLYFPKGVIIQYWLSSKELIVHFLTNLLFLFEIKVQSTDYSHIHTCMHLYECSHATLEHLQKRDWWWHHQYRRIAIDQRASHITKIIVPVKSRKCKHSCRAEYTNPGEEILSQGTLNLFFLDQFLTNNLCLCA